MMLEWGKSIRLRRLVQILAIGLALVLPGCPSPFGPSGGVQVRVANASAFEFARVDIFFPAEVVNYGNIPAHGATRYHRVTKAYAYAVIEVEVGGEVLRIQPIDYVGEPLLRSGRYTYELNVTIEGDLTLELRTDD